MSSDDSEEEENANKDEYRDKVADSIKSPVRSRDSEERDKLNLSEQDLSMSGSKLTMMKQFSEKKSHKMFYQQKPVVVDIAETQSEKSTMQSVTE